MVAFAISLPLFTSKFHSHITLIFNALIAILFVFFRFRTYHGWRRLDFASPSRMDRHIEMMMAMEKALIQAKCLAQPVIYIMPEVDKGIIGNLITKVWDFTVKFNSLFVYILL